MRFVFVALVVLLVACNGGATDTTVPTPPRSGTGASTTTISTTVPAPPPASFEEAEVELSEAGYLVDAEGMALYVFMLDTDRASSCEGDCARAWPPLLGDPVAGEGVDQSLLGNAERGNGAIQVTYGGQPLYRYHADEGAGDTNGHGFNDLWFLVGPDGAPLDS